MMSGCWRDGGVFQQLIGDVFTDMHTSVPNQASVFSARALATTTNAGTACTTTSTTTCPTTISMVLRPVYPLDSDVFNVYKGDVPVLLSL